MICCGEPLRCGPDDERLRRQYDSVSVQFAERLLIRARNLGPEKLNEALETCSSNN